MNQLDKRDRIKVQLENEKEKLIELLPPTFRDRFREESFVGGGAIYSLYNDQEPKDIDFFVDNEDLVKDLRSYFALYLIGKGFDMDKKVIVSKYKDLNLVFTKNAISIGKYQIITRWVGEPEEVVNEFDFKHNMFYIYKGEFDTFSQWDFLEDNVLRYNENRARDICGTIIRTKKFVERGFKLTNREMAKMLLKLNEVGFNEREMEILEHAEGNFES